MAVRAATTVSHSVSQSDLQVARGEQRVRCEDGIWFPILYHRTVRSKSPRASVFLSLTAGTRARTRPPSRPST